MIDDLDRAQAEINDEIRSLETLLRNKGYVHGKVEAAINWIGHPVWIGVTLTKRYASDMQFHGDTPERSYGLADAFGEARRFIEALSDHVQWTPELVGQTLGIEPDETTTEEAPAAA